MNRKFEAKYDQKDYLQGAVVCNHVIVIKQVNVVRTVQCTVPELDPKDERMIMQQESTPKLAPTFLEQLTSMTPLLAIASGTSSRLKLRTDVT